MSQLFASGGQSIGVSASTSVLPMNIQDWLDLLAVQETVKSLLQHHSSKAEPSQAGLNWGSPNTLIPSAALKQGSRLVV